MHNSCFGSILLLIWFMFYIKVMQIEIIQLKCLKHSGFGQSNTPKWILGSIQFIWVTGNPRAPPPQRGGAPPQAQWTMNTCLATIGIHHEEHRERALAIGEALGIYRDYPTSKGCTSPFAPIWINEMVSRQ